MTESPLTPESDPDGAPTEDPELTPPVEPDGGAAGLEPSVTNPDADGTEPEGSDTAGDDAETDAGTSQV